MKVGIIGAGTMGSGIAQAFARQKGMKFIYAILMMNSQQTARIKLPKASKKESLKAKWNRLQLMLF